MVAINETAYPRFKYNATKPEIRSVYTPDEREQSWMRARRVNPQLQQVYMVYLKCFQRLGYFPKYSEIPNSIREHIAETLDRKPLIDSYGDSVPGTTLRRIKTSVRRRCHVKRFTLKTQGQWLREFAFDIARTKESVLDIVNAMIEFLVKESYELPAFSTLDRLGYEARAAANSLYINRIYDTLHPDAIKLMASILEETDESGTTLWHKLKEEPKRPSINSFTRFYQHSKWVRRLSDSIGPLPELPEAKRYQLVMEAKAYTRDKISSLQHRKRIALAALLVNEQAYYSTDCLVGLFIREIRRLHNKARADLTDFQRGSIDESEKLITMLLDVATARSQELSTEQQMIRIDRALLNDPETVALRCDRLVHHGLTSHLPFLKRRYQGRTRRTLLNCLTLLEIDHTAHGGDLLACLEMIMRCKDKNLATMAVNAVDSPRGGDNTAIDWIGQRWSSVLYQDQGPHKINRMMDAKVFEIAVLSEVAKRFQSGDLFVNNSTKYDDYRKHLISWEQYNASVSRYTTEVGLSPAPIDFTNRLKKRFQSTARRVDRRFPKDGFVEFASDHIHVRRRKAVERPEAMERFDAAISDAMPPVNILDLLAESSSWVELQKSFKPVSGHQTKIEDYMKRLVVTLFCYGCNVGPVQTARSIKGLSRKQIAYLNLAHTREKDLIDASKLVVNAFNKFELPSY